MPQTGYTFGKDAFFTYGPLGYLQVPLPIGDSYAQAMIFSIAIHLLLGALLFLHWRVTGNRRGVWMFATCYLLLNIIGFGSAIIVEFFPGYYLIMICGLALSLGLKRERWLAFGLITCAIISSLQLFIKFNTGLAVPGAYWDFWDHYVPITENSLAELLKMTGFDVQTCIPRFLPYTISDGSQPPILFIKLYLKLPVIWPLFGKQFLVVAQKPGTAAE